MSDTKLTADKTSVYLHIEDLNECCFEVWEEAGQTSSLVKVKIPIKTWKGIIKQWKKSNKEKS